MVNDHLSDFVTRIRNGYNSGAVAVETPLTKSVERVAEVLQKEGYVSGVSREGKVLKVELKYSGKTPAIMGIRRVSKPGARIYSNLSKIPRVWGGLGISILSTSKGVISSKQAYKLKTGGEIICQVW